MEDLPSMFERFARQIFSSYPELRTQWEDLKGKGKRLTIYKNDETGFEVVVQAETYGLYPFAGDWYGPPWEMAETQEVLCKEFLGFILTLLCEDSMLEVRYAGKNPYEWILTYPTGNGLQSFETGGFPFNFFGEKSTRTYKNCHLPARYKSTKEVE